MPWKPKAVKPQTPAPKRDRPTTVQRGYGAVHRHVRAAFLQANPICMICNEAWSEQLDHKNGDVHDRRPENLQATCPQCHARKTWESMRDHGHG